MIDLENKWFICLSNITNRLLINIKNILASRLKKMYIPNYNLFHNLKNFELKK